jgi:hypothetical protein
MPSASKKKSRPKSGLAVQRPDRPATHQRLSDLHFDTRNPRFGPDVGELKDERKILDRIVEKHGVNDLLSSLAVNGYSDAEPMVGLQDESGKITIIEGNRRLAACLILSEDHRAKNQQHRSERYRRLRREYELKPVDPIPVTVFQNSEYRKLLPYLGVRHIVGAEEWSAYAKAAWMAKVLEDHNLEMDAAMAMIGDEQRQMPRNLTGYYFVQQLIELDRFDPHESEKKGGSGSEFPFSLIYNALGYKNIKKWVGLESDSTPRRNPIPQGKLDAATEFMDFICGNLSKGIKPVANDNRAFRFLNQVAGDEESLAALRRGEPLEKVASRMLPAPERLIDGLVSVRQQLEELNSVATQKDFTADEAFELLNPSRSVFRLSSAIYNRISEATRGAAQNPQPELIFDGSANLSRPSNKAAISRKKAKKRGK